MRRLRDWPLYVALLVLTAAAFSPVWGNGFVDLDDEVLITRNPFVYKGWTGEGFRWAWTTSYGGPYQPLTWLSLQTSAQLFSTPNPQGPPTMSAAAFHTENLLWHAGTVVLLFGLWQRLTGARGRSLLVAALFAVHPLRVESVAWATERKDVLSCFFGVLALWAYVRYVERPGWRRYLAVCGALLLSLLAKPMLLTLPFVLLLLDYWPLGRRAPGRLLLEKVPLFALAAAVAGLSLLGMTQSEVLLSTTELPLGDRLANVVTAYGWYVAHTFYPVGLAAMYPHPYRDWSAAAAAAGAATLLAVSLLAAWQARRPWLLVGWLWFVGSLVPVLGLVQGGDQAWADRYTYWPHIGLLVAVVWGLAEVADRARVPAAWRAAAATFLVGVLAALTWVQVGYWRNTPTLWERALAVTPENFRAQLGLGDYYQATGRLDLAASHYAEGLRLRSDYTVYRFAFGSVLHQLNREDEAAEQFQEAVRQAPHYFLAWLKLGEVRLQQGETAEAARCFRRALDLQPEAADALAGLGEALWQDNRRPEAVWLFREALRRDPGHSAAWHGLGLADLAQGQPEQALAALDQAMRSRPHVHVMSDLGVALGRTGRWADAARLQFRAAQLQDQADRDVEKMGGRPAVREAVRLLVLLECRLAFAWQHLGKRADADQAYREALRHDREWPGKFAAKARVLVADPDVNRRDPHLAFELASQAVAAVANPPAALRDALALARAALGQGADPNRFSP
jgi:tetratricopeptide (TPR) repeat protein